MKMDIANYEIKAVKPILMKQAVKYECEKFDEYLKENKGKYFETFIILLKQFYFKIKIYHNVRYHISSFLHTFIVF